MLVGFFGSADAASSFFTPPNGMSESYDVNSGGGNSGVSVSMAYVIKPTIGASGDKVATGASSAHNVGQLLALRPQIPFLHHLHISAASSTGVTCAPTTLTITACQDTACAVPYLGGVSGNLSAAGTATVNWEGGSPAFTIPALSSSVAKTVQVTTANSPVTFGIASATPSPGYAATCDFGGSSSCSFTATDAGFVFDVPSHVSEVAQTVTVSAGLACTPAFANVSKTVTFTCGYQNPASGTLPVRVGGTALNAGNNLGGACDASGNAVSLNFNASGEASTSVQYADAGSMLLNARYAPSSGSEAGLVMTGSDSFVAAPASFGITTGGPYVAGQDYNASITAKNSAGVATPNFGLESPSEGAALSFAKNQPTGSGANDGVFTGTVGSFASGTAPVNNPTWSEVGTIDLSVALSSGSYLGSGFTASGSLTGIGPFVPAYFDLVMTPTCGSFAYSGQPFLVQATANRYGGGTTLNYDGSADTSPNQAHDVNLSEILAGGVGSLVNPTIPASVFAAGIGAVMAIAASPVSYLFATHDSGPPTLPTKIQLHAADSVNGGVTSSEHETSAWTMVRRGRLRLFNAFGSEKSSLSVPVQAQYWSEKSWVINADDNCTQIPASSLALSYSGSGWSTSPTGLTLSAGQGNIVFAAPSPAGSTGSVDVAANLGTSGSDQSCLASHGGTASNQAWLRAQNGSCASTYDRDPSARASFGVYAPETAKQIHVRELFQ
ncbi:MAG: hypothetical protein PHE55_01035 [Methylococcaceae bacterium]|nr:hypothetical protein [Methylococcaceae bacterium]